MPDLSSSIAPRPFDKVLVPAEVFNEVVSSGFGRPGAVELQQATWAEIVAVPSGSRVPSNLEALGAGEAGAIAEKNGVDGRGRTVDRE